MDYFSIVILGFPSGDEEVNTIRAFFPSVVVKLIRSDLLTNMINEFGIIGSVKIIEGLAFTVKVLHIDRPLCAALPSGRI